MALIIVGGQTKNVGKTTLICNIIAAFSDLQWTALKITTHAHTPQYCGLHAQASDWSLWEQNQIGTDTDTGRFLSAGAQRSFLLEANPDKLSYACSAALKQLPPAAHVIVESTSAAERLDPDLFLVLIDPTRQDIKKSTREQLVLADAVLCKEGKEELPNDIREFVASKPVFKAMPNGLDRQIRSMLAVVLCASR